MGWLTTKDFQTTTILYYTFFLPGVVLYELTYWLAAGLLNVRAETSIKWPEKQDIGRLELNFVKLPRDIKPLHKTAIGIAPLILGTVCIGFIANNVLNISDALIIAQVGTLNAVSAGINKLLQAPDFWLWLYVTFTIGNTMLPKLDIWSGIQRIALILVPIIVVLTILGTFNAIVINYLNGPVAQILNTLSVILAFVIAIDILTVGLLSAVENTIEWVTGDSADFRNGKMVTMTREERLARRMREIEKQRQTREKNKQSQLDRKLIGPPSIYSHPFPILGEPGEVEVTPIQQFIVRDEKNKQLGTNRARAGADIISGKLEGGNDTQAVKQQPQLPEGKRNDQEDAG